MGPNTFLPSAGAAQLQGTMGFGMPFDPYSGEALSSAPGPELDTALMGPGMPMPWDSSFNLPAAAQGNTFQVPSGQDVTRTLADGTRLVWMGDKVGWVPEQIAMQMKAGRSTAKVGASGRTRPSMLARGIGRPSQAPEEDLGAGGGESAMPSPAAGMPAAGPSLYESLMQQGIGQKKEQPGPFGIPRSALNQLEDTGITLMSGRNNELGRQAATMMALRKERAAEDDRETRLNQNWQMMLNRAQQYDSADETKRYIADLTNRVASERNDIAAQRAQERAAYEQARLEALSATQGFRERSFAESMGLRERTLEETQRHNREMDQLRRELDAAKHSADDSKRNSVSLDRLIPALERAAPNDPMAASALTRLRVLKESGRDAISDADYREYTKDLMGDVGGGSATTKQESTKPLVTLSKGEIDRMQRMLASPDISEEQKQKLRNSLLAGGVAP